jgi:serine/threonine protein kinase
VDELLGKDFGPYRVVEKIAEGGMAVVYKGYQESLNRYVALKVLRKELTSDRKFIARFRREALAVAKLSHPNILHIHDANLAHGRYYIAMEYVDGGSLKDLLAQGPLPIGNAIDIAIQLADALDYAHREGLIHRDVKPANVLLTRSGRPKLADFGIVQALHERSALTMPGSSPGTPMYMSPEQAGGQSTDSRTDIYSLGIVLYEMLAGRPPFNPPSAMATLYQQVNEPPPPIRRLQPQVPRWLEAAISTALAKHPRDRYQQASEFAAVLRQRQTPTPIRQSRLPEETLTPIRQLMDSVTNWRSATWLRGRGPVPFLLAAILIVFLALLGGGAYMLLANPPPDVAPTERAMVTTPAPSVTLSATTSVPTDTATPTRSPTATPTSSPTSGPSGSGPIDIEASATPSPTPTPTPTHTPTPTPSVSPTRTKPTAPPTIGPTRQPGVIADFETFGTWRRGDEPNGTFTQSRAQSYQGSYSGMLVYDFDTTDNDYVVFQQSHPISGQPTNITAWVYGDGSGHFLNLWVKDNGGQVWQVPLGRVTHTGWQQMIGTLDVNQEWPWTHISGPDNGRVDFPVSFEALVLDDNPDPSTGQGTLYIDDLRATTGTASGTGNDGTQSPTPRPTTGAATAVPPSGSLTGRIAFTVYNPGIRSYALYTVRPDGNELHPVLDYVHQPDISPDGKRIVVDGVGGGIDDLWSLKIDGSDRRQLTTHTDDRFPTWAPNGQSVAFSSTRQGDGLYRLYTIYAPIGTGKTKFILGDYPAWLPTWEVVFNGCDYGWGTDTRCGLWRVSDGRQPLQITDNPQDICTDGTAAEILFLRPDADNWDIYRVGLGGGTPTRLTDSPGNDGPAAFSPDGGTVAFLSTRSGAWALYTMNRQGGNVKKVIDLPMGGNYNAAPLPWTSERISWGPMPTQPSPPPTPAGPQLLPAPQILFPIPDDTVSSRRPTTIRWSWSGELGSNQGFEVRFWPTSESSPMGVAPPTTQTQLEVNFGLSEAYRRGGEGTYYLGVVVVQVSPYKVLSQSGQIRVKTDPNK